MLSECDLAANWRGHSTWRILDTSFGGGSDFFKTWQTWRNDSPRPPTLHYVALATHPPCLTTLLDCAAVVAGSRDLAGELAEQWFGLRPGFHRFTLNGDSVLLTLCIGEVASLLRQQQFLADAVFLKPQRDAPIWDRWTAKALARCCRRGTQLFGAVPTARLHGDLAQCGFEFEPASVWDATGSSAAHAVTQPLLLGQFNPRWQIKHRPPVASDPDVCTDQQAKPGTCAVIGAGLAGASVAAALARRGWRVQVLDAGEAPATGASGLPVGLVVPHVSVDDCTLSRLSRSGVRLMLQQARTLLKKGQDWDATGTLERRPAADWNNAIWHPHAAWLKPAALVCAWLAQPGIAFQGHAKAASLRRDGSAWAVLDATGRVLACADRVVIANAMGAVPLLATLNETLDDADALMQPLPVLHGVRGQVSWGLHGPVSGDAATADAATSSSSFEPAATPPPFPPFPVNGLGSVVAHVPTADGPAWFVGANYQPVIQPTLTPQDNHRANLARVTQLLPALGAALSPRFDARAVHLWQNTRCVSTDRLPLVGPLTAPLPHEAQSSVWLCVGMGSRGLTFSALCAELLAAHWGGEPLPVEASLAAALCTRRHADASRPSYVK